MQLLLNPENLWLGKPGRSLQPKGPRPPVAIGDAITVLEDSNPVIIDAVANDVDPEGGALTIVSAFAALGTATLSGGVLRYQPIAGFTGFDSIIYEIENATGGRDTAQIDITVAAASLSVARTDENRLEVVAQSDPLTLDVTGPRLAGSFSADAGDLAQGPVNLAVPTAVGTPALGEILTAKPGLWIGDVVGGAPARSWQWQRDGIDIPGATAADHIVQAADQGATLIALEILTDTLGSRSAAAAPMGIAQASFTPAADPAAIGWWDAEASGTITQGSGGVATWQDRIAALAISQSIAVGRPATGQRSLGGRNVLDFDGGDHMTGAITLPASGDVAFHLACVIDGTSSEYAAVLAVDAAQDFQIDAGSSAQFDGRLNVAGIGTTTNLSGGPFSGPLILSLVFNATAGQAEVFVGGVSRGTMAYTVPIDAAATLCLMTNRSTNASIDGAVAELIVTGDVTSRASYHAYLSDKWGIA